MPLVHGTTTGYSAHKCRCDDCRAAQRNYMRSLRGSALRVPVAVPARARSRAVMRLIRLHPDEFQRLCEEEATA